jgi:hypothetical protein
LLRQGILTTRSALHLGRATGLRFVCVHLMPKVTFGGKLRGKFEEKSEDLQPPGTVSAKTLAA